MCCLLTRAKFSSPVMGSMVRDQNIFQEEIIAPRRKRVGSNLKWRQSTIAPKRKPISQHYSDHVGDYKNTIYNKKFFRCLILIKTYVVTITNVGMMWFTKRYSTFKSTSFFLFSFLPSLDKIREGFGCALSNQTPMTHFNIGHLSMKNVLFNVNFFFEVSKYNTLFQSYVINTKNYIYIISRYYL